MARFLSTSGYRHSRYEVYDATRACTKAEARCVSSHFLVSGRAAIEASDAQILAAYPSTLVFFS